MIDKYKIHSAGEDVRAAKQRVSYCHVELEAHNIEWCKASDVDAYMAKVSVNESVESKVDKWVAQGQALYKEIEQADDGSSRMNDLMYVVINGLGGLLYDQ